MPKKNLWTIFSAAPHRMMMFGGSLQLLAVLVFWSLELLGRYSGLSAPLSTALATTPVHGFLMIYMLFLFFIYGFLMTTYPRWMNGVAVPRKGYIGTFALLFVGAALFYAGAFTDRVLVVAAVIVFLAGHSLGIGLLYGVYRYASAESKFYETLLNGALIAAWVGMGLFAAAVALGQWQLLPVVRLIGIWWFLMPVLVTVSHRMIPFFSSCVPEVGRVHQPSGGLYIMLGGVLIHGLLEITSLEAWTWVVDLPVAVVALHHAMSWGLLRSFRDRLLAMLHVAFAWFALGMLFFGAQSLGRMVTGEPFLGLAPLHALGIGFALSMTLAMASRVTLGHSGRTLQADGLTWTLFWGVSAAAVIRIGAETGVNAVVGSVSLNVVAASILLLVILVWVLRYAPMYLRARVDGKPG